MTLIIDHMKSHHIVHRDIRPENILIEGDGHLKLIDFSIAKRIEHLGRTFTICGTPEYMAPEMLLNLGYAQPVDWWALGVLIYELHNGFTPFMKTTPMDVYTAILNHELKFPKTMDKNAKSLCKHLI